MARTSDPAFYAVEYINQLASAVQPLFDIREDKGWGTTEMQRGSHLRDRQGGYFAGLYGHDEVQTYARSFYVEDCGTISRDSFDRAGFGALDDGEDLLPTLQCSSFMSQQRSNTTHPLSFGWDGTNYSTIGAHCEIRRGTIFCSTSASDALRFNGIDIFCAEPLGLHS
jgi:hypothetical protein